jgi:diguanylate cyclase (GGDEF)-like protein/PAS domain S-box-containing protein
MSVERKSSNRLLGFLAEGWAMGRSDYRRRLGWLLLLLAAWIAPAPTPASAEPPKSIRVVTDDDYPPYVFRDDQGRLQGILKDLWDLWAARTGIPVDLAAMDWDQAQRDMASGKADAIDTVFETDARKRMMDFSEPYATIDVAIFFREDLNGIKDADSLHGFTVGVKGGDACIDWLSARGISSVREYPSYESLIEGAANREVLVFCIDMPPARYFILKKGLQERFRYTEPLFSGQAHWAVHKGDNAMRALIADGFARITPEERKAIESRWLGRTLHPVPDLAPLARWAAVAGVGIAILLAWNWLLRRKVASRTAELTASKARYDDLVTQIPVGAYTVRLLPDGTTKFEYVSPRFAEMTDLDGHQVLRDPSLAFDIAHPDDREELIRRNRQAAETLQPFSWEGRFVVRGQLRWMRLESHPTPLPDGSSRCSGVLSDITAQHEAESALRESELRFRLMTASVKEYAIFMLDPSGIVVSWNEGAQLMRGFAEGEILGQSMTLLFTAEDVAAGKPSQLLEAARREGWVEEEGWRAGKDGSRFYADVVITAIRDSNGELIGFANVVRDITERKKAEKELSLRARRSQVLVELPGVAERTNEIDFLQYGQEQAEQLTGSEIAFIHFVQHDQEAIEMISWSRRTQERYCTAVYDRHYQVSQAGMWAEALRCREAVVVNDYATAPGRRGVPEGHAVLTRFVSVPVIENDKVVMLASIGNKREDYEAVDVETLQLIANAIWSNVKERRNKINLQLAASVFTHAREGILIADPDGVIIDVNETFCQITGYGREEAIGQTPHILKSGRHPREFYVAMWQSLADRGHWYGEIWNRRKNGEVYPELLTISAVRDADGTTRNYVAMFTDIQTIKEHQQQIEHIAHHDILTNLPNRVLLADRLRHGIAQSQRRGEVLVVAYLDLDDFKEVNDRYGHNVGDELLVALANQMKAVLRKGDTLARIGGDEFLAILADLERPQDCEPLLERLLKAASSPMTVGEMVLQVSASIGATLCPRDGNDADLLIRQADQAMYLAKQAGRNCYHLFDRNRDDAAKAQSEVVRRLRQALERREFVLHYQPKVDMRAGSVIGAEALIRWQHPEQGLLWPGAFLPAIEDHPIGIEIGEWVIGAALAQMADWRRTGLEVPVSVNVGAHHLQQPDFVMRLGERLRAHPDVPPSWLELEILETSALADVGSIIMLMRACQEMGVRFALDDFGTGYSSLTYLRRLPAEQLKIDQTFVRNMLEDQADLAIVSGIVGLARALGREVIAEGVETPAHGEILLRLGCEMAQGFGIARPMPARDFPSWVANWKPETTRPADPAVRRRLSDDVVDRLRAMITSGKLQPGAVFPSERELMDRFRVGRPAIREAMQTLSNMGLVTTTRGERSRLRQVTTKSIIHQVDFAAHVVFATSPTSVVHLKDARLFFERGVVRLAALKATSQQIAKLRANIEEQRAHLGDPDHFISADMQFHIQIAAIADNPLFEGVSEAMLCWLKEFHTNMLIWSGKEHLTLAEHEDIVRAIESHDPDVAEKALVRHLERAAAGRHSKTKPQGDV